MKNKLKCMVCYKDAELEAYGNTYCIPCYEKSPYYAEVKARKQLDEEKGKK